MVTMTESGANAKKIRNSVLYESEEETKEIISKLSKSERKSVISEIDRHDDVNLLGFLAIKDQDAAIKQILKDVELDAANLEALQWALEDAIVCGNEKLTKLLMVRFSEVTKGLPVSKREQVESDLMVAACNKSKSNKSSIIQLLYDHGFRVRRVVENDLVTDQQKSMQNTEYHYELYQEIKAQCCPHYLICRADEQNERKLELDSHTKFRGIYSHETDERVPSIYDDSTIFGIALPIFSKINKARSSNTLYVVEYKEMSDELEQFLVELVHLSEKDEEHLQLAKVDDHSDLTVFSDREFIPLIKEACDRELKSFATNKVFRGMVDNLVTRYFEHHLPWWNLDSWPGTIGLFLAAAFYPFLCLSFLIAPHSFFGEFSHYAPVSMACEAISEIYFLIFITVYPYIATSAGAHLGYNIALCVLIICKIHKEFMEILRRSFKFYIKDLYNILDWSEIVLLIIVMICRFIENPFDDLSKYGNATLVADCFFSLVPIFIMVRVLFLFRIQRQIGILQISFSKMGGDVAAWITIVMSIMVGFAIAFHLFARNVLGHVAGDASIDLCTDTQFNAMIMPTNGGNGPNGFWNVLSSSFWVMLDGPSDDGLSDCFGFHGLTFTVGYLLMATFSLMVIIVLVNLLIAMMSKTHDSVCDKGIRETEWSFHMMNLWVKFIRRDFVAPIPMNILPHFHKHLSTLCKKSGDEQKPVIEEIVDVEKAVKLTDEKKTAERKESILKAVPTMTIQTNTSTSVNVAKGLSVSLAIDETVRRNAKYEKVVYTLCKRYRRKHLSDE